MTNVPSERAEEKLNALSEAVRAVTAEFSLDRILRRMAEIAAHLVRAKYAALGVPDGRGGLAQFLTYGMTDEQVARMEHYPRGLGLIGALMTRTEPLRVDDMSKDTRSAGFCAHHPRMTSFLGVPIISKGKHLGNLYLCDRLDGQPFTEDDERMISLLAANAAIAIENARLSDQLRKLAVIEERDRISMELHDGIIQSIYAIGIKLELTRLTIHSVELEKQIKAVNEDLNRVIEDLRRYIRNLRAGVEFSVSLREQLEEILERFRQVSPARIVMDVSRSFTQLTEARLHALIQITREALSNIVRHSNATEVYLDLHETATHINLVISDNGNGFDVEAVSPGIGLHNIRQRTKHLGGTVEIVSQPGRGATITVSLPF
jgi:signal transduction histidine kinase